MGKYFRITYEGSETIKQDGFGNCAWCGEYNKLDPHHTITQSRGGDATDVVFLCRRCHSKVDNKVEEAKKLNLYRSGYKCKK